jgi:hypothetical protein
MVPATQALELAAIELRIACPRCGASAPIDTVTLSVVCEQCEHEVALNDHAWHAALGGVDVPGSSIRERSSQGGGETGRREKERGKLSFSLLPAFL